MTFVDRARARLQRDTTIVKTLRNWPAALAAELLRHRMRRLVLRSGSTISAPPRLDLLYLFDEVWVERVYCPPGFLVRPGEVVFDVGANIGVFSVFAATQHPSVQVHAFEPLPECVRWLESNVSNLPNVRVRPEALADRRGSALLQVNPTNWLVSSLERPVPGGSAVEVNCVTLEQALDESGVDSCGLLKLDCEGSEFRILRSASAQTLKRVMRIVAEYHESATAEGSVLELARFLEAQSFNVAYLRPTEPGHGYIAAARHR